MSTNLIAILTSGPNDMSLMKCFFRDGNTQGPSVLMSQAVTFGNNDGMTYNVIIESLQREDGTGKSWNFEGTMIGMQGQPCKWKPVTGYFSTKSRQGHLEEINDIEEEIDPRTLLEEAMAKNPDFIKELWALINGFVNHTTIHMGYRAMEGYNALEVIEPYIRGAERLIAHNKVMKSVPQFMEKECTVCHNMFNTNNGSDTCYNCTLERITHGQAPEEGDFNTAKIISGTMTAQERTWLQQDLEAIENGTSSFEYEEREYMDEEDENDWEEDEEDWEDEEDDDDWEYNENEAARWGDEG